MEDPRLALRQSLALLATMSIVIAAVYHVTGEDVIFGALLGVLMAILTAIVNGGSGLFGDPDRAGWLGGRR